MDQVEGLGGPEVAADGPRLGVDAERLAEQPAADRYGVVALDHHGHDGPAGDEFQQRLVERLADVLGIVPLGQLARDPHHLHRDDAKALVLEPGNDSSDQSALHAVRFDEKMFCDHKCCFVWKKMLEVYTLRKTAAPGKQPDNNNVMNLFPVDMLGWISSITLRCPYGSSISGKSASPPTEDKSALIDEIVDKIYREMEEAMLRKRLDVLKEELHVMLLKGEIDKSKNDEYISLLRRLKVPPSAGSPPSSPSAGTYPKI